MVEADGSLRAHWRPFVSMMDDLGRDEIMRRWEQARRLIRENGITHNVYGDPNGLERPWNLDLIPLLIPDDQWRQIEAGLAQRARLLDRILADLYGPARSGRRGLASAGTGLRESEFPAPLPTTSARRRIAGCISTPPTSFALPTASSACWPTGRRPLPAQVTR